MKTTSNQLFIFTEVFQIWAKKIVLPGKCLVFQEYDLDFISRAHIKVVVYCFTFFCNFITKEMTTHGLLGLTDKPF